MNARARRHAIAGTAAAIAYLTLGAGSKPARISARVVALLLAGYAMPRLQNPAMAKASTVEQRINDFFANGGTIGGPVTVSGGVLNAAGGFKISGTTLTLNHGTVSVPGGAPSSYDPVYASAQSAAIGNLQTHVAASNLL